jgi:hypothetical protein
MNEARDFVWAVALGLLLGGVLVLHAGRSIARAFPDDMRAAAWATVRTRPRMAISAAVIAAWSILYALYSLAYPTASAFPNDAAVASSATDATELSAAPTSGGISFDTGGVPIVDPTTPSVTTPVTTAPASGATSTGGGNAPAPVPCSVAAQAQAVRDAQVAVEMLTGDPLGADGAALVEALAGCKDPTNTALSMLGVVNQLLNKAGITEPIPLPDLPGLPPFAVPEPIAAPLRTTVFDACGQITREIYTVATVSSVIRLEYSDFITIANYVGTVCAAFAPQGAA